MLLRDQTFKGFAKIYTGRLSGQFMHFWAAACRMGDFWSIGLFVHRFVHPPPPLVWGALRPGWEALRSDWEALRPGWLGLRLG